MNYLDNNTSNYFLKELSKIKNPIILELGVNKGGSTSEFLKHINEFGGDLYSIDIKDCSNIINNEKFKDINFLKWNFLQSNDLNLNKIFLKFPNLKNGIDILYIDSYHDETHVKKTLEKWFYYVKKNGYIFFDDTESLIYRKKKNFALSVNNDSIDNLVKRFFYNNSDQIEYTKYFKGSGLSMYYKISKFGTYPKMNDKIWNYNSFLSNLYLILKKIIYFIKSKDKS